SSRRRRAASANPPRLRLPLKLRREVGRESAFKDSPTVHQSVNRYRIDAVQTDHDAAVGLIAHFDRVVADHFGEDGADALSAHINIESFFLLSAALENVLVRLR